MISVLVILLTDRQHEASCSNLLFSGQLRSPWSFASDSLGTVRCASVVSYQWNSVLLMVICLHLASENISDASSECAQQTRNFVTLSCMILSYKLSLGCPKGKTYHSKDTIFSNHAITGHFLLLKITHE